MIIAIIKTSNSCSWVFEFTLNPLPYKWRVFILFLSLVTFQFIEKPIVRHIISQVALETDYKASKVTVYNLLHNFSCCTHKNFPVNSLSVLKRPYPHLKFHKHMLDTRCNNPQYTVSVVVIENFRTLNYQIIQRISTTFNKYMKCISSNHSINYTCRT